MNKSQVPLSVTERAALEKTKAHTIEGFLEHAAFAQDAPDGLKALSLDIQQKAIARGWQIANAREAFNNDDATKALNEQMTGFRQVLQKFQKEAVRKYVSDVDLNSTHDLKSVIKFISDFSLKQKEHKTFWGRVTHGFRELGSKSPIYKQWLELLPTQNDYLSVLCGGLKLVIGAMQRMKQVREEISQAFEALPTLLLCSFKVDQIFLDSELHICSLQILGTTFDILRYIMLELLRSAAATFVKAVFKQDLYAEALKDSLGNMRRLHEKYQTLAAACSYEVIHNIESVVTDLPEQITQESRMTRADIQNAEHAIIEANKQTLESTLRELFKGLFSEYLTTDRTLIAQSSNLTGTPIQIDLGRLHEEILQMLKFNPDDNVSELAAVKNQIWRGPSEAQDRLFALLQDPRFADWFTQPGSSVIFVNENRKANGGPSALSHLCARMADRMQAQISTQEEEDVAVPACISVFCGSSTSRRTSRNFEPGHMLRALIGQLISTYNNFDLPKIHRNLANRDNDDSEQLWHMFRSLVRRISTGATLFCLIDNITIFEVREWRHEVLQIVEDLVDLATAMTPDRTFKVLMTCPESSRRFHHCLEREAIIDIPYSVPKAGGISDKLLPGLDY